MALATQSSSIEWLKQAQQVTQAQLEEALSQLTLEKTNSGNLQEQLAKVLQRQAESTESESMVSSLQGK